MGNKHFTKEVIALGKLPYVDKVQLNGTNPALSTSWETVWQTGGTYAQLLAGVAMEAVSSNAADAAAGTGARTIQVDYIDGNYAAGSEIITLNGATPVPLVATSVLAINKITVLTVGSGGTNAGTIDVRVISGASIKSRLTAGTSTYPRNETFNFNYTLPAGFIGLLSTIKFSASPITGDLYAALVTHDTTGLELTKGLGRSSLYVAGFNAGQGEIFFDSGLLIPEKTHIELKALVSAGVGDFAAQAELLLFDVKNCGLF